MEEIIDLTTQQFPFEEPTPDVMILPGPPPEKVGLNEEKETCVICLDAMTDSCAELPCGHKCFHYYCLRKNTRENPNNLCCPLCRKEFQEIKKGKKKKRINIITPEHEMRKKYDRRRKQERQRQRAIAGDIRMNRRRPQNRNRRLPQNRNPRRQTNTVPVTMNVPEWIVHNPQHFQRYMALVQNHEMMMNAVHHRNNIRNGRFVHSFVQPHHNL